MATTGTRKDMYDTRVKVDGVNLGTWDVLTGGEVDSDELKYKPGAMGTEISLGGTVTIGQVVLQRNYQLQRDHTKIHWLLNRVGKGNVVVTKQPLDANKQPFGKPITYSGILKRVLPPEVDSNATDAALVEIEITPHGNVT